MSEFDGIKFSESLILIIVVVLLFFGSTNIENLTDAPDNAN